MTRLEDQERARLREGESRSGMSSLDSQQPRIVQGFMTKLYTALSTISVHWDITSETAAMRPIAVGDSAEGKRLCLIDLPESL